MKHSTQPHGVLPLLFLLIITLSLHSARASRHLLLPHKEDLKVGSIEKDVVHEGKIDRDEAWDLMGLEECEDRNMECLNRRVISEAHLDYIYTQSHNNP